MSELVFEAEIKYKRQSIDYCCSGHFGNIMPTWRNLEEYYESGYENRVMLRYNEPNSQYYQDSVPKDQVESVVSEFVAKGARREWITVIAGTDPGVYWPRKMNGEIRQDEWTIYSLYYALPEPGDECLPMRPSLAKSGKEVYGLRARELVRYYASPSSWSDMETIWERWPGAVIEFTVFRGTRVGDWPKRDTVIYEVRNGY